MDWESKPPSWDFAELERDAEPSIGSVLDFTSLGAQKSKGDCSVDLKLGGLGDFGEGSLERWKDARDPSAVSPSVSSKRSRGANNGSQTVSCLVDGCKSDLSNCREYHKRHKVCEVHAKTPTVMVGGRQQRFCQQCSRFHSLEEFDEVKRSCRKRLDGHNRRRRKPQPDSLSTTSTLYGGHQGGRFSSYQQILATTLPDPTWPGAVKSEEDSLYSSHTPLHFFDRQNHFPVSFSRNYKASKNYEFGGNPLDTSSTSQHLLSPITTANTDCALSLLSSPSQSSSLGLVQMVQADRIPMAQPLIPGLQYRSHTSQSLGSYPCSQASNSVSSMAFSSSEVDEGHVGPATLVSDGRDANLHHQQMFLVGGAEAAPPENGASTLPIFWHG